MPINRLLVLSAVVYAVAGLPLLFAADVILRPVDAGITPAGVWMAGMMGGALVAFALLNWFNRHQMMGGIYGRPLLIANLMLLTNVTFPALRMWRTDPRPSFAIITVVAGVLLVLFGRRLFRNPDGVGASTPS